MKQLKIEKLLTVRETRGVEIYLQEVEKLEMISPEEEIRLAKLIQKGDEQALEKLVLANLRFVVSVAKKYQNKGLPLLDLINEGNVGLITAAKRFDPSRGFKFISYAVWWIRQNIMSALTDGSKIVRMPSNKTTIYFKVRKFMDEFEQKNEREATAEELYDIISKTDKEISYVFINEALTMGKKSLSLDGPLTEDSDFSLFDLIPNPNGDTVNEKIENDFKHGKIELLLTQLSHRESEIIRCYFGIDRQPITLEEMAKTMYLTRERVRQIKDNALKKMRYAANKNSKILELA